jgi:hypothetical protein
MALGDVSFGATCVEVAGSFYHRPSLPIVDFLINHFPLSGTADAVSLLESKKSKQICQEAKQWAF